MAITLTPARNGIDVHGNRVWRTWNVVWTTYTALGEPLTARQLGMTSLDFVDIEPAGYGGVSLVYDPVGQLLHAYTAATPATNPATEVAGATDLSWLGTVKLRAAGTS